MRDITSKLIYDIKHSRVMCLSPQKSDAWLRPPLSTQKCMSCTRTSLTLYATVVLTNITHRPTEVLTEAPVIDYISEPDVVAMLKFFSTQTRTVLCNRAVLETRLALLGARLMKMQRGASARGTGKSERRTIHRHLSTMKTCDCLKRLQAFSLIDYYEYNINHN